MSTREAIFESARGLFGSVPTDRSIPVCDLCRGPVNPTFALCIGCERLLRSGPVPESLRSVIVPMTTAIDPSPWYSRLIAYKRGVRGHWPVIAALVETFLSVNRIRLRRISNGPPNELTAVPSKRGVDFRHQALVGVLRRSARLGSSVGHLLTFRSDASLGRSQYDPSVFEPGPRSVVDRRVVLIEDTWVTGATCLSAAGALLEYGARSVVVMPIGRCINESFWRATAPEYLDAIERSYEPVWPR